MSVARLTQLAVEAAVTEPSTARLTQLAVEVLHSAKVTHIVDGDLVGGNSEISGVASIVEGAPLIASSFMFLL